MKKKDFDFDFDVILKVRIISWLYQSDTNMIIPCQTAFVRNEANRICVTVSQFHSRHCKY